MIYSAIKAGTKEYVAVKVPTITDSERLDKDKAKAKMERGIYEIKLAG